MRMHACRPIHFGTLTAMPAFSASLYVFLDTPCGIL